MPKWATVLLSISGATIALLIGVIGTFSIRTLDLISDEIKGIKSEVATMNRDYGRLSQSVAVMMAVHDSQPAKTCRFPESKQEKN